MTVTYREIGAVENDLHGGRAATRDRAVIISLVAVVIAVAALGTTAWLAVETTKGARVYDSAAFDGHKAEMERRAAQLEQIALAAEQRAAQLEQSAAEANERTARAEHAREIALQTAETLENELAEARHRIAELEETAERASALLAPPEMAAREAPPPTEHQVAADRGADTLLAKRSQMNASLAKFAGAKAAVYVLEEASGSAEVGSWLNARLIEAGWASLTWRWVGVDGITGVTVLIKDGSDPVMDEAASGTVDALRAAGFNATKANWPADWRRLKGTLIGPQTPSPTEAPIRIVVGAKAR